MWLSNDSALPAPPLVVIAQRVVVATHIMIPVVDGTRVSSISWSYHEAKTPLSTSRHPRCKTKRTRRKRNRRKGQSTAIVHRPRRPVRSESVQKRRPAIVRTCPRVIPKEQDVCVAAFFMIGPIPESGRRRRFPDAAFSPALFLVVMFLSL
jgi:hypothetical protein